MDFLRQIVGGPKNRFKENGYNLDLTYITDRVIAMAFPASGFQKLYRNSVDSIRQLLQNAHQNKYITINISGRPIEQGKLRNVSSYDWQDHKAPPFETLFAICQHVASYLIEDVQRAAVFHCNHGKGRTGTIICCFLLYLSIFSQTKQVMKFYEERRFVSQGYGVTQPCQILYIQYFQQLLEKPNLYPQILTIKAIQFKGIFQFQQPYIKIYKNSGKDLLYNSKDKKDKFQNCEDGLILKIEDQMNLIGDILIQFKDTKSVGHNLLISYSFHTAFINSKNPLKVKLSELSPLGKQKLNNFGPNFEVVILMAEVCACSQKRNIYGCGECKGVLKTYHQKWQRILLALKKRQNYIARGSQICFGKKK